MSRICKSAIAWLSSITAPQPRARSDGFDSIKRPRRFAWGSAGPPNSREQSPECTQWTSVVLCQRKAALNMNICVAFASRAVHFGRPVFRVGKHAHSEDNLNACESEDRTCEPTFRRHARRESASRVRSDECPFRRSSTVLPANYPVETPCSVGRSCAWRCRTRVRHLPPVRARVPDPSTGHWTVHIRQARRRDLLQPRWQLVAGMHQRN
jgi:hypothetical protein